MPADDKSHYPLNPQNPYSTALHRDTIIGAFIKYTNLELTNFFFNHCEGKGLNTGFESWAAQIAGKNRNLLIEWIIDRKVLNVIA